MPKETKVVLYAGLFVLSAVFAWYVYAWYTQDTVNTTSEQENTGAPQTVSFDGALSFATPGDFGLAVTDDQILVQSYIPPCDSGFDYCLYYKGDAYGGTNFESAGLAITKRPDLTTQKACMETQPTGYTGLLATTTQAANYAMVVFAPLGDAGAGHYGSGTEYRLYTDNRCYQFDTRIGETQFGNYPEGTITEFTDADRSVVSKKLLDILRTMKLLPSGETLMLP